ncbi:MAG: hypothetical protein M5U19_23195 [Microthrixaceae bacterium]|nr:hypothetical protein [Microthrixaceae bacterium]
MIPDPDTMDSLTDDEIHALSGFDHYQNWDSGYSALQSTRPQSPRLRARGLTGRSDGVDPREVLVLGRPRR